MFKTLLIASLMILLVACACSNKSSGNTWTREGTFDDEANDVKLTIEPSDSDEYEGWYVGFYPGGDMYGWYISQEGDVLHGDLLPDETDEFIVTVSEEGDDGVKVEVEGGETYHFTPATEEE